MLIPNAKPKALLLSATIGGQGRCNGKIRDVFVETHERFDTFRLMPKLLTLVDQFAKMETPKVNLFWV